MVGLWAAFKAGEANQAGISQRPHPPVRAVENLHWRAYTSAPVCAVENLHCIALVVHNAPKGEPTPNGVYLYLIQCFRVVVLVVHTHSAPEGEYTYCSAPEWWQWWATTSGSGGDCTALSSLPIPATQLCATAFLLCSVKYRLHWLPCISTQCGTLIFRCSTQPS